MTDDEIQIYHDHKSEAWELRAVIEAMDTTITSMKNEVALYRWLRSRSGLDLRSDGSVWTRPDGTKFVASHYLAEGNTQHAPKETLDETIANAMREDV